MPAVRSNEEAMIYMYNCLSVYELSWADGETRWIHTYLIGFDKNKMNR